MSTLSSAVRSPESEEFLTSAVGAVGADKAVGFRSIMQVPLTQLNRTCQHLLQDLGVGEDAGDARPHHLRGLEPEPVLWVGAGKKVCQGEGVLG